MELLLERAIEAESKKRLAAYSRARYYGHKYRKAYKKRTGKPGKKATKGVPTAWTSQHKHFDPRFCHNHARFIARGIWRSLKAGTYKPLSSIRLRLTKPSGGFRVIDSFSIPDAAVAKIFLNNLRERNAKIFSDSSYAYQADKTPLDAVIRLNSILSGETISSANTTSASTSIRSNMGTFVQCFQSTVHFSPPRWNVMCLKW